MNPKIESFVVYEHHANEFVLTHKHNSYEFVFYRTGNGYVNFENGNLFNYQSNSVVITNPDIKHNETNLIYTKVYIINFSLDKGESIDNICINLNQEKGDYLYSLLTFMEEEFKERNAFYKDSMSSFFKIILNFILREKSNVKKDNDDSTYVKYAKKYIKENCTSDIDFTQLAKSMNYSYDRFRHIFKEKTGKTLNQYLFDAKLYLIKDYLSKEELSLKEIAEITGFNSYSNFVSFFTSKVGISPNKFRKRSLSKTAKDIGVLSLNDDEYKYSYILDTDLSADCDDVGALSIFNMIAKDYDLNVLGITYTTSIKYGPIAIDNVCKYFGNEFDIGITSRKNYFDDPKYLSYVVELSKLYKSKYEDESKVEDAVKLMRRKLSQVPNSSAIIISIGQLNNISDLLDSLPDEYSSLNGIELVKEKVQEIAIMGGLFRQNDEKIFFAGSEYLTEYNIASDIKSSKNVVEKCPVDIVFSDFLLGYKVKTFSNIVKNGDMKNPITLSYKLFGCDERESWDPITVFYELGQAKGIIQRSKPGRVTIDNDGNTKYTELNDLTITPHHYYLKNVKDDETLKDAINKFVERHF